MPAAVMLSSHGEPVGGLSGFAPPSAASPTTRRATPRSLTAARSTDTNTSRDYSSGQGIGSAPNAIHVEAALTGRELHL